MTMKKFLVAASAGALLLARVELATARPRTDRAACATAYTVGRELQQEGHLRQAEQAVADCVAGGCGRGLSKRCRLLRHQIQLDTPSVVPVVDQGGQPLVDVQVTVDGQPLTSRPDGRALPVDPGWHTFVFTAPDGAAVSEKVFIGLGQHNHPLHAALPPPRQPRPPAAVQGSP
jgi:hypothetical protein